MNRRTLAQIFDGVPNSTQFPWDAFRPETNTSTFKADTISPQSALLQLGNDDSDSDGDARCPVMLPMPMASAIGSFTLDVTEGEQREAIERSRVAHQKVHTDRIDLAREQANAAVLHAASRPPLAGAKRPRQSSRIERSDPDVIAFEKSIEAATGLASLWESRREKMTADEQESLLLSGANETKEWEGAICLFNISKGYGFIAPDCGGPDIYFVKDSLCVFSDDLLATEEFEYPGPAVGERVVFAVALNDTHSSRRLKAENIRFAGVMGDGSSGARTAKRFTGKVRHYNSAVNRGYLYATNESSDLLSSDSACLLHRCHSRGIADAMFSLTGDQLARGFYPPVGTAVQYSLLSTLDVRSGKIVAVHCSFSNADCAPTDGMCLPELNSKNFTEPESVTLRRTGLDAHAPLSEANSGRGVAPQLLLLDDADAW